MSSPPTPISEFASAQEKLVESVRESGDPAAMITAAKAADDAIRAKVGAHSRHFSEDERTALVILKRLLFNSAADCWPGWGFNGVRANRDELKGALDLARSSAKLVKELGLGSMQAGTANWLVGAFHIALHQIEDALNFFAEAENHYRNVPAPGLELLVRGYIAITYEVGRLSRPRNVPDLDAVTKAIAAGPFEDREFFCEQLQTARRVFL